MSFDEASAQARAEHGLPVPDATWRAFLAARPQALEAHVGDLYLACACAAKVPGAAERFFARHAPALDRALERVATGAALEDAKALALSRVLGDDKSPGTLSDYAGTGPLGAWLQVVAVRAALELRRKDARAPTVDVDAVLDLAVELSDPDHAKRFDRGELKGAFSKALAALPSRERTVLRLNFLEGLNIEEIGELYQVHRATVARWISSAREQVRAQTRAVLAERHSADEVDGLLQLADERLDVSLSALLSVPRG